MNADNEDKQYISEDKEAVETRLKKLKRALKQCTEQKQEYLLGWQRSQADFQNYKKQQIAEREGFLKFANSALMLRILPVLDNLVLVSETMPASERRSSWANGIDNIQRQFMSILADIGLAEIPVREGDKFNPELHEAIGEAEGGGEAGTIAEILQKGYSLNGQVIRAARVKVIT